MVGPLALVGGNEFRPPARDLDATLLEMSGSRVVTVVPTAAARSRPELAVGTARGYFRSLGADVQAVMVLDRSDATLQEHAEVLAGSRFIYLAGGSPRLLADVLRDTPAWEAILAAHFAGAVLAGSSAGAMVLCERMLVPGGAGVSDGLGMIGGRIVLPHHDPSSDRTERILQALAGEPAEILGIDECTGLVIEGSGGRVLGSGGVTAYRSGEVAWARRAPATLAAL